MIEENEREKKNRKKDMMSDKANKNLKMKIKTGDMWNMSHFENFTGKLIYGMNARKFLVIMDDTSETCKTFYSLCCIERIEKFAAWHCLFYREKLKIFYFLE